MIDPVTKSGFLASTSMATIDDESNAEDVHVLENLKLNRNFPLVIQKKHAEWPIGARHCSILQ